MKTAIFAAFLCMAVGARAATTIEGVTFPDTYPAGGETLHLNGVALRSVTILGVHAYVVALYLPRPTHDAATAENMPGTKVIWLQFLHSASKAQVEHQYREGEQTNCGNGGCSTSNQADFERLVAAAPAVAVGDTSTYIFTPTGMRVLANNRVIGDFANPDLAHLMMDGFIGAHPPSAAVKAGLLGLTN